MLHRSDLKNFRTILKWSLTHLFRDTVFGCVIKSVLLPEAGYMEQDSHGTTVRIDLKLVGEYELYITLLRPLKDLWKASYEELDGDFASWQTISSNLETDDIHRLHFTPRNWSRSSWAHCFVPKSGRLIAAGLPNRHFEFWCVEAFSVRCGGMVWEPRAMHLGFFLPNKFRLRWVEPRQVRHEAVYGH